MKKYAGRCPDGFIDALNGWDRAEWRLKRLREDVRRGRCATHRRRRGWRSSKRLLGAEYRSRRWREWHRRWAVRVRRVLSNAERAVREKPKRER